MKITHWIRKSSLVSIALKKSTQCVSLHVSTKSQNINTRNYYWSNCSNEDYAVEKKGEYAVCFSPPPALSNPPLTAYFHMPNTPLLSLSLVNCIADNIFYWIVSPFFLFLLYQKETINIHWYLVLSRAVELVTKCKPSCIVSKFQLAAIRPHSHVNKQTQTN